MRPSSTTAIRSWLHQQRPLDRRESNQLLNLLTTSFRGHLDREHPTGANPETDQNPSPITSALAQEQDEARHGQSAHVTTAKHLNMLLSNPILNRPRVSIEKGSSPIRRLSPADSFDAQVANGRMDLAAAKSFLECSKTSDSPYWNSFKVGTRTLKWLSSSGLLSSREVLQDKLLTQLLVDALCEEGQNDIITRWTRPEMVELAQQEGLHVPVILRWQQRVIAAAVRFECVSRGLDSAITRYLEICRLFRGNLGHAKQVLFAAQLPLARRVVQSSKEELNSIKEYDQLHAFDKLNENRRASLPAAIFEVYSPRRATVELALEYIKSESFDKRLSRTALSTLGVDYLVIWLCLTTAKLLVEKHRYQDATYVLDRLRSNYPQFVDLGDADTKFLSNSPASQAFEKAEFTAPKRHAIIQQFLTIQRALKGSQAAAT